MPTSVAAYAAPSATEPLVRTMIERRDVGPRDVLIRIQYAGICHSDIHTVRGEWRKVGYPLVVGHEIAGVVEEVGAEVTRHRVGDRVGVGCMVNSCGECESCLAGEEQYCRGSIGTYNSRDRDGTITQGGYSTHVVVDEDFVLRIPDALDLAKAAPLLCAGITTYSPLRHWGVGHGTRVAIVGLGGLGHMGVKFAHAFGADVTVLSHSLSKRDDGLALGADDYRATSDAATFAELKASFDVILNTVSVPLPIDDYLSLLRRNGTLVSLGVPAEPFTVAPTSLLWLRRSWAGSSIGGIRETQEMLDYSAEHGIEPETELIGADRINEAWDRVVASDVRYRFVIDIATL